MAICRFVVLVCANAYAKIQCACAFVQLPFQFMAIFVFPYKCITATAIMYTVQCTVDNVIISWNEWNSYSKNRQAPVTCSQTLVQFGQSRKKRTTYTRYRQWMDKLAHEYFKNCWSKGFEINHSSSSPSYVLSTILQPANLQSDQPATRHKYEAACACSTSTICTSVPELCYANHSFRCDCQLNWISLCTFCIFYRMYKSAID